MINLERKTCLFKNCTRFKICYTLPLPSSPFPPQNTYGNLYSVNLSLLVASNLLVTMIPPGFSVFFFLSLVFCSCQLNGAPERVGGLDTSCARSLEWESSEDLAVAMVTVQVPQTAAPPADSPRRWPCSAQPSPSPAPLGPALLPVPPLRLSCSLLHTG